MALLTLAQIEKEARTAGYHVVASDRLRANRWLLVVRNHLGQLLAVLVQSRSLISEADVQDLAEVVRLRRYHGGILLIQNAQVSPHAQRTLKEFSAQNLHICASIPAATAVEPPSGVRRPAAATTIVS